MGLLHCGKNKAQEIAKDKRFAEAIFKDGRKLIFDSEKVMDIMRQSNQPKKKRP